MKKIVSILLTVLLSFALLGFFPVNVYALAPNPPWSKVAHPNNQQTIRWELDGTRDGDSCHNHRSPCDFHGREIGQVPTGQPYEAYAVWDCNQFRVDNRGTFDRGHGFINEWGIAHVPGVVCPDCVPDYWFDITNTSDPWPRGDPQLNYSDPARNEIRRAFSAWSAIQSDDPNLITGIEFRETNDLGDAEIIVRWKDIGSLGTTSPTENAPDRWNQPDGTPVIVTFDSNPPHPWWYGPQAFTPADKYHFFSTALHEIGHVVGLDEQDDYDEVMIRGRDPGPNDPVNRVTGPAFDEIDEVSKGGARDLYSIPKGNLKIELAQKNCIARIMGNLTQNGLYIPGTDFDMICDQNFVWAPIYANVTPNDIQFWLYIDWDKNGFYEDIQYYAFGPFTIPFQFEKFHPYYPTVDKMVVVEVSQDVGPDVYRYITMGGMMDTAGQLGLFDPWYMEGWRNNGRGPDNISGTPDDGGVPFATRPPYLTPMLIDQTITFTQKDPITGIIKISVSTEGYILNHTYWDPRIGTWVRVHIYSAGQGCGWIFTGQGKEPILGDVDLVTWNNDTGIYSSKTGQLINLQPCLQGLTGADGIPGTGDAGDIFGDGKPDGNGSSILYLPMNLYIEWRPGAAWLPLCIAPFPMLTTTGNATDVVIEPDSPINGQRVSVKGQPWEFIAGLDTHGYQPSPTPPVPYGHPNWNAYVTYACVWSMLNVSTRLGGLDIIYEVTEKLVREDCVIADIDRNELVDIFDLVKIGLAYNARDEGWGKPVADSNFDGRADLKPEKGLIDIFDLVTVGIDYNSKLTPDGIIRP